MKDIQELSLFDYISVFGSIVDLDVESDSFKKRITFKLWKRQKEACDFMELPGNQIMLLPKSRQKGYSEIAAERALKTLMENENTEGAAISKSEDFAKYFLQKRMMSKYKELIKKFPEMHFPKVIKETKEEIVWEGNRVMKSISCSSTAAASLTLDFLIIDEAGGIDEGRGAMGENSIFKPILNNSIPACDQNANAWIMIIGTSVPGTYYNQLVREAYEAEQKGEDSTIKYFFIGWHHQPGRDRAWYFRQRDILKEDVYLQHPTTMADFFFVKDGLVFQHFDQQEEGTHIKTYSIGETIFRKIKGRSDHIKPSWNLQYITSYDHGTNHPAVNLYGLFDKFKDILYIFDETFFPDGHGTDVSEIAQIIQRKMHEHPIKPHRMIADGAIYNDIGIESVGDRFKKYGLKFKKAKKHDEAASRDLLSSRFRDNTIVIHSKCIHLIDQLRSYRWDPKSKGEKPIQKDDDAIDALRYMCAECKKGNFIREADEPAVYSQAWKERLTGSGFSSDSTSSVALANEWQQY